MTQEELSLTGLLLWVEQLGLEMMPLCALASSPFTSGITSGTSGQSRYAEELSMNTAPAAVIVPAFEEFQKKLAFSVSICYMLYINVEGDYCYAENKKRRL